jgi:hypothetical protein
MEGAAMTKRYRERIEEVEVASDAPAAFRWRGQRYQVLSVLGHWHEDEGWWRRADGVPERIERTDLWRVEARNGVPVRGVYELVRKGDAWRLDRIWD